LKPPTAFLSPNFKFEHFFIAFLPSNLKFGASDAVFAFKFKISRSRRRFWPQILSLELPTAFFTLEF
jgi:hypothetical protein